MNVSKQQANQILSFLIFLGILLVGIFLSYLLLNWAKAAIEKGVKSQIQTLQPTEEKKETRKETNDCVEVCGLEMKQRLFNIEQAKLSSKNGEYN